METIREKILSWLEENEEAFNEAIEELDSWNGYLGDDRYYEMYMLDDLYSGVEVTEILRRAFYGYDEETTWTDERGEKHYGEFNPNREYFSFNGYGNLVSSDYKDYSAHLDDWFVNALIENQSHLYLDRYPELEKMLQEAEEEECE